MPKPNRGGKRSRSQEKKSYVFSDDIAHINPSYDNDGNLLYQHEAYRIVGNLSAESIEIIKKYGGVGYSQVVFTAERALHIFAEHPEAISKIFAKIDETITHPTVMFFDKSSNNVLFESRIDDKEALLVSVGINETEEFEANRVVTAYTKKWKKLISQIRNGRLVYYK